MAIWNNAYLIFVVIMAFWFFGGTTKKGAKAPAEIMGQYIIKAKKEYDKVKPKNNKKSNMPTTEEIDEMERKIEEEKRILEKHRKITNLQNEIVAKEKSLKELLEQVK